MKVGLVVNSQPFYVSEAEKLANRFRLELIQKGHESVVLKIPFCPSSEKTVLNQILMMRLLNFNNVDQVICFEFPTFYINHPKKALWLTEPFFNAYTEIQMDQLEKNSPTVILEVRNAVIGLNASLFSQFTQIKCANPKIANELNRYLNIQSEVSYAPPQYLEVARESESSPVFNSYFFFPGEIGPNGRHELMIRAMQKIDSQIKLVIAGSVRKPEYYESLQKTVADLRLQERVQFIARNISQSEEMKQYQTCLASIQFASQNDYDSVSLESFCFKKPVITLKDVESNLETVIDQKTGIRVGTHPDELAQSVNLLARQKGLPSQLGEQGYKKLQSMDLSWKRVIGDFNL